MDSFVAEQVRFETDTSLNGFDSRLIRDRTDLTRTTAGLCAYGSWTDCKIDGPWTMPL